MAWTTTSWSAGCATISVALLNEFESAVNERQRALDGNLAFDPLTAQGATVDHARWEAMQQWVEDNLTSFIVSHDAGTKRSAGYYDNKATIDYYANLAAVFSAAGLGTATWRAYTTHPTDAGADQARQVDTADIMGHWNPEDLQKVLNVLVWTGERSSSIVDGDHNYSVGWNADWPTAKGICEAAWPTATTGTVLIEGTTAGSLWEGPLYKAEAGHADVQHAAVVGNYSKSKVEYYLIPIANYRVFDGQGDWAGEDEDKYNLMETLTNNDGDGAPATATMTFTKLFDHTVFPPNWCAQPNGGDTAKGYETGEGFVVLWNVTDGFDYTDGETV